MNRLLDIYQLHLAKIDSWFSSCADILGNDLCCKPGCSSCCRGLFDISLPEALLLQRALDRLRPEVRARVRAAGENRLRQLQRDWPFWRPPYLLNGLPDSQWTTMPENDAVPCPLLDENGLCLVYESRPLTCRLHGLPARDAQGLDFSSAICSKNRIADHDQRLFYPFADWMREENRLFHTITIEVTGRDWLELDTFIPVAILWRPPQIDWRTFNLNDPRGIPPVPN